MRRGALLNIGMVALVLASCAGETPSSTKNPGSADSFLYPQDSSTMDAGAPLPDVSSSDVVIGNDSAPGPLRLSYTPVQACRIVNTRNAGDNFAKDEQRSYFVHGDDLSAQGGNAAGCKLPAGIGTPRAAHINVIALSDEGQGNFAVFRHGLSTPTSGLVNFHANTGQPYIGNAATVMLCPDDETSCDKHIAAKLRHAASAGLVIDVLGYYTADTTPDGHVDKALVYTPVKPCRVVDTREKGGKLAAGQDRDYFVYGDGATISAQGGVSGGCPSPRGEPSAAHLRLITVVLDAASQGNVGVLPADGDSDAVQSFVNYKHGYQNTGNTGTIKTDHAGGAADKDIKVINRNGTTHVIIDVLGYYYPNDSSTSKPDGDYLYTPVQPCRIADTRTTDDPFADKEVQAYQVHGSDLSAQGGEATGCAAPSGEPRAAHLTFVAVPVEGAGYFRAFAADLAEAPFGSGVLNYKSGTQNIANAATIATEHDPAAGTHEIKVTNKGKQSDLAVTVLGYYYEK